MRLLFIICCHCLFGLVIAQNIIIPEELIDEPESVIFDTEVPEFPGGIDSLHRYVKKSFVDEIKTLRRDTIIVQFIIRKDGTVNDVSLLKGKLDKKESELLYKTLYNMPLWSKVKNNVKWTLPIILFKDKLDYSFYLYESALQKICYNKDGFLRTLKEAIFLVENAYLNNTLNYQAYDDQIKL